MVRIALIVAAAAIGSFVAAAPASADTNDCHTLNAGPFPTVEMCLNIPNPVQ